ncbi:hypothetical protein BMT54_08060 [Pasteurellaceae bacterium 15-036681]|nr:hypothetical protein BMT54_08060 [Pasteurellaceae bacterium 15-036681]
MYKIIKLLLGLLSFTANSYANEPSDCIQTYSEGNYIHIAKINLNCKNLELIASDAADNQTTVSNFAKKYQTNVAINANFYMKNHQPIGLVISNGKVWRGTKDTRFKAIFACDKNNRCMIEDNNKITQTNPKWQVAISGWQVYNAKLGKFECPPKERTGCVAMGEAQHPRSMIGLDSSKSWLYLVVVEGRQLGFSGYNLTELAQLAQKLGIDQALNLDGGGSSTLVVGNKRLSKLPFMQMSERTVANHFGVKARVN